MPCKPPVCRQPRPPGRFPALAWTPRCIRSRERTYGRQVGFWLPARSASDGHSRRNAVGRVSVKLVAAPDAPHWGEVLVRIASGPFPSARERAASTFTCLSREHPVCPAHTREPGEAEPRSRWPASSGGGRRRGRVASRLRAGWHTARYPAWVATQTERAAYTAVTMRQRASTGRTGGRCPHPWKDPL